MLEQAGADRAEGNVVRKASIHTLLAAIVSNVERMARLLFPKEEKSPDVAVVVC